MTAAGGNPRTTGIWAEHFCPEPGTGTPVFLHRSCEVGHFVGTASVAGTIHSGRAPPRIREK